MTDESIYRIAVLMPTYNNAGTLGEVFDRVAALDLSGIATVGIVVVNDGSTDQTAAVLEACAIDSPGVTRVVVTHPSNHGKAAALHSGFAEARRLGATHAATIDTDLQHDPEDIPRLIEVSMKAPDALVIGARGDDLEGMPARSLVGRRLSNLGVRLASGVRVTDSQSGLRVYPLSLVENVRCRSGRYGFETEIITRAGWLGRPTIEVPITSRYLPLERRVSHFRPWVDSLRCIAMHARLLGGSLIR